MKAFLEYLLYIAIAAGVFIISYAVAYSLILVLLVLSGFGEYVEDAVHYYDYAMLLLAGVGILFAGFKLFKGADHDAR